MEPEQRCRSGAGTDQRTGVDIALGDDAVERRLDLQVLTEILDGLDLGLAALIEFLYERTSACAASAFFCATTTSFSATTPGVADAAFRRSYVLCAAASLASASARCSSSACAFDCASTICAWISGASRVPRPDPA